MATPITWRNVDSPTIAGISQAFQAAQSGLNSGFDKIGAVLKEQQAIEDANWNQQKVNNTNDFMNMLAQYRTPEEYQAALDSGVLGNMLASKSAQIDQQAARQAMEARLGNLQERITKSQAYSDTQQKRTESPIRDSIGALIAQGKFDEAKAMLDKHTLTDETSLYTSLTGAERTAADRARTDAKNKHTDALAAIENPLELQATKDRALVQQLETRAAKVAQEHEQSMRGRYLEVGSVAKELGLPVDSSGRPRIQDMNTTDLAKLDTGLKAKGLPSHLEYLGGDTKARDSFLASLEKEGVPAHVLNKLSVDSLFNSGGRGLAGQDAEGRDWASAANNVMYKKIVDNNWFSVGHPDAKKAFEELQAEAPKLIDRTSGWDADEDIADVQATIYKFATQGVSIPGRKEKMIPPVELVRNAVRTAKGGLFTDAQRAGAIERIIEDAVANYPDLERRLKESAEAEQYLNKEEVKAEKARRRQEASSKLLNKDK